MHEGEGHAVVVVRAACRPSRKPDEIVHCVAVTPQGEWLRLFPLQARKGRAFKRWDIIRFAWAAPGRIDPNSLSVVRNLLPEERRDFMDKMQRTSLKGVEELALIKPQAPKFAVQKKKAQEIEEEQAMLDRLNQQAPLGAAPGPSKVFPYKFTYSWQGSDGPAEAVFHDWDMDAAFGNLVKSFGEPQTMARIVQVFGREYPARGMLFAVGRDAARPGTWVIHGVISMDEAFSLTDNALDVVA